MQWVFYSGYLSTVDIVFRFQLTIPPITELSIAETPNNRSCKTFLVRNFYTFYFRQSFTAQLKFPSMFVSLFLWQFDGLFRFTKMKFIRDFLYAFKFMVDAFPEAKMSKAPWGQGQKHKYNHGDFCCTWPTSSSPH